MRIDTLPQSDLRSAIDLKILAWSPYDETGRYVVHAGKYAMIWIWDQKRHVREAAKYNAATVPVVPETLLQPCRREDSVRLLTCCMGYEGQLWVDGVIMASHWWEELPDNEQWYHFLLRNDAPPCDLPQILPEPELLAAPWARHYIDSRFHWRVNEHRIVKVTALLLFLYMVWLGSNVLKSSIGISSVRAEIAQKENQVASILTDRSQAFEYRDRIDHLKELVPYPSQLQLIDSVVAIMPVGEILKWDYQQGTLNVSLTGENPDPQIFVQRLESSGLFTQVVAQRGKRGDQLDISMQVLRKRESR